MKKNQSGFTTVEIALVLLVVTLVSVIGFMIYKNGHESDTSNGVTVTKSTATQKKPAKDPTANWTIYTSDTGKFAIKYPKTWVKASNPELCSDGIFLLGANSDSVGKCGSEDFGQIAITWQNEAVACPDLSPSEWSDITRKEFVATAAQTTGVLQTGVSKQSDQLLGAVPAGAKLIQYCIEENNITYHLSYTQLPSYPDAQADFNTMVTKTLQFAHRDTQ
jgi:hypothetical protein